MSIFTWREIVNITQMKHMSSVCMCSVPFTLSQCVSIFNKMKAIGGAVLSCVTTVYLHAVEGGFNF